MGLKYIASRVPNLSSDLSEAQGCIPSGVLCPQMPEPFPSPFADFRSLHVAGLNPENSKSKKPKFPDRCNQR